MAAFEGLHSHTNVLLARDGGLHPPPDVLRNWPPPNYVNPENRGWGGSILILVALGITFLVYVARIWARIGIGKNFGLDDTLISIAMLPLFGLVISSVLAMQIYGFQWHVWDQTSMTLVTAREITMAIELNYIASTTIIKVSILCFYRRMSASLTNVFVYCVWGSIFFCVGYALVFMFLIVFTCSPAIGFYHIFDIAWRFQNELQCRDEGAIIVAVAATSTVQDLVICLLPVFLIWNLQIPRRQKLALCGIFGMGLVTCLCGILRTYYATYVYYYTYDITWYAYYGWIWTALEATLGVICASAPALKLFFNRYFTTSLGRTGYSMSGSRKTPVPLAQSNAKASGHSAITSLRTATGDGYANDIQMDSLRGGQKSDTQVDYRDDLSQKSDASTRILTASHKPGDSTWGDSQEWVPGCHTDSAAFPPSSRDNPGGAKRDKDIEKGI